MSKDENFNFINIDGCIDNDRINKEISSILEKEEFSIPSEGLYQLIMPLAAIILFAIIYLSNAIFVIGSLSWQIIVLIVCIILLICTIVIPFFIYSNQLVKKTKTSLGVFEKKFRDEYNSVFNAGRLKEMNSINEYCSKCLEIREGNVLNAYNLYTYEQILKIEERVGNSKGDNRAVFSYSTYRDDGDDVGIAEAEEIVKANKEKGVKYYEVFYVDPVSPSVNGDNNEVLINLSKILGPDEIEQCLDYRFYKDCRFDVMIYQWDDDCVEGYFCLNFPLIKECPHEINCPIKCTLVNTDRTRKVFYKKMVPSVTLSLHQRLKKLVETETNSFE